MPPLRSIAGLRNVCVRPCNGLRCRLARGPLLEQPLPRPARYLHTQTARADIDADVAIEAIAAAGQVPGRFQSVSEGQDFAVLVDYAHTPDSLENVLRAARGVTEGRLHVVFGCGGDRDRGKRPLMGEIAARLADRVIVTSDNPRSEDPAAIIDEILVGSGPDVEHEVDRRIAIEQAISTASGGDVVVIAGKGHEQGQEFEHGRKIPFDDVTVAREILRGTASNAVTPAR